MRCDDRLSPACREKVLFGWEGERLTFQAAAMPFTGIEGFIAGVCCF